MIVRRAVVARPSPGERSAWLSVEDRSLESYESNRAPGPRGGFLTWGVGGPEVFQHRPSSQNHRYGVLTVSPTPSRHSDVDSDGTPSRPTEIPQCAAGPTMPGLPPIHGSALRLRVRRCARRALQLDPLGAMLGTGPVCPFCKGPHEVAVQLLVFTCRTPACP